MNHREETKILSGRSEEVFEISHSTTNDKGEPREVVYREDDPNKDMESKEWGSARGVCFCGDKMVIVRSRGQWGAPGGRIESGETLEQALAREIQEETNMRVLEHEFIGYIDIIDPGLTRRYVDFFCEVEPVGPFVADPDVSVTEIKLIDPQNIKEYFDWGEMGNHIVAQALKIKEAQK